MIPLLMTIPTIILGVGVLHRWAGPTWVSLKRDSLDSTAWFIIGVFVAFMGFVLDSLYWCLPIFLTMFGVEPHCEVMRDFLPYNLIIRQIAGMGAAYCHLKASGIADSEHSRVTNRLVASSYIVVAALATIMWLVKGL